ncbi:MAG: CotH kinase family protein, partial [Candidatus Promineifilaceae bacterium]|nr:CotH kinase family protein [Candidatus Promineifilaceae bacterium]
MGNLVQKIAVKQWWVWPLLFMLIAAILLIEQQASSAQDGTLATRFSHPAGRYDDPLVLELSSGSPDAEIYYTLDGQIPDSVNGSKYSKPLVLDVAQPHVVVVRARSILPDGTTGPVFSVSYFMGMDVNLPLLSIIGDPADFWDETRGIYVNHGQRGRDWERPVDLTYVSENDGGFQVGAGIRVHGGWTRYFSDKKSLRLYFRREYGAPKLDYPLFGSNGQISFDQLVLHNSSKDLLLFRNQLVERLSEHIGGFATRSQPVLVFINGRSWGIYHIRERIDERLLAQNFGVPGADISDTPNNRGMQSAQQLAVDTVHWENFMEFVEANNLTNPDNYAYLQTQIDLANFIDYYLLQMYAANSDWPHHNVHQFRPRTQGGRWEWIVWDNDLAFDRVERQMVQHVLDIDHPLGARMETLLNKLLANPEFHNLFLTRAADLLNTNLSTINVLTAIDELVAELDLDIGQEKARWDISSGWEDTQLHMQEFATKRPEIMRQHFVDSMGLSGIAEISFEQATDGDRGWIVVNDSNPQQLPWKGSYFQGTTIRIQAIPPLGQRFSKWESEPELNLPTSSTIDLEVKENVTLSAHFSDLPSAAIHPGDVTFENVVIDDTGDIEGDWFDIRVNRNTGVDLGGWRITDNDTTDVYDEGSLIFRDDPLLTGLPQGTVVRVIATESRHNTQRFPDDVWQDGVLIIYTG